MIIRHRETTISPSAVSILLTKAFGIVLEGKDNRLKEFHEICIVCTRVYNITKNPRAKFHEISSVVCIELKINTPLFTLLTEVKQKGKVVAVRTI